MKAGPVETVTAPAPPVAPGGSTSLDIRVRVADAQGDSGRAAPVETVTADASPGPNELASGGFSQEAMLRALLGVFLMALGVGVFAGNQFLRNRR